MPGKISSLTFILFIFFSSFQPVEEVDPQKQWSQYRGHQSNGAFDQANLPQQWDARSGENIRWKKEIPGLGLSSPVIWGEKLFITTAIGSEDQDGLKTGIYGDIGSVDDASEHEWKVYCINKNTGQTIWERTACKGIPEQKRHPKSSHANSSAATDGKYVVVFFGSEGLYCYTMEGDLVWHKDFGVLRSVFFRVESAEWEFASSPILYDGTVIVQCDVMENSFIAAFEASTGRELWKQPRDEYPGWCTPNIYMDNGKPCIAVNGYKHRGGYDFKTGEELWRMSGGGDIQVPTPVIGNDLIYFNSAHGPSSPILAIQTEAKGTLNMVSGPFIEWSIPRGGSYMQTLLLYKGLLYNLRWNGNLVCFDAKTGALIYDEKLGGKNKSFTASPVAADDRIYAAGDDGTVYVIQAGKIFQVLSEHGLDDVCMVTPAITQDLIYFRTQRYLIAVGNK